MMRISMARSYALIALVMSILVHARYGVNAKDFSDALNNPVGGIYLKTATKAVLQDATGKDVLIERKVLGVPLLSTEELNEVVVDTAQSVSNNNNCTQVAEDFAVSLAAAKITTYLAELCNHYGLALSEEFVANHPDVSRHLIALAKGGTRFAVRLWLQGAVNQLGNKTGSSK